MQEGGPEVDIIIRQYQERDLPVMTTLWNRIVESGDAFPQSEPMAEREASRFFADQTYVGVAEADGTVAGLYILHPNNIGRCGHIANASYAVSPQLRGLGIGRSLVLDSMEQAAKAGFRILQFNAVVTTNTAAIALYESIGFTRVGTIPEGFRSNDGAYEDIIVFYIPLKTGQKRRPS
jgi:L-amino acid N-acyltransferase YncA